MAQGWFKRVCSWCGSTLREGSTPCSHVTHSICSYCIAKVDQQIAAMAVARGPAITETTPGAPAEN